MPLIRDYVDQNASLVCNVSVSALIWTHNEVDSAPIEAPGLGYHAVQPSPIFYFMAIGAR